MPAHRMKVESANFCQISQKSVTLATLLERSRKEDWIDHAHGPTHVSYHGNLVKIGKVHFEIIGLAGYRKLESTR